MATVPAAPLSHKEQRKQKAQQKQAAANELLTAGAATGKAGRGSGKVSRDLEALVPPAEARRDSPAMVRKYVLALDVLLRGRLADREAAGERLQNVDFHTASSQLNKLKIYPVYGKCRVIHVYRRGTGPSVLPAAHAALRSAAEARRGTTAGAAD